MISPAVMPKAAPLPISAFTTSVRMKSIAAGLSACGSVNSKTSNRPGSSVFVSAKSTEPGSGPVGSMPRKRSLGGVPSG
jgi:hypothetical protein